ncbi:MAG: SpoIIE family protein phosphatase [Desulfotalea sp.]
MLKTLKPTQLGQRIILFVLFPTIFILLGSGYLTFNMAKTLLIKEWTANTNASLKNGASIIDHQLRRPQYLLELIRKSPHGKKADKTHKYLLQQLREDPRVISIDQKLLVDGELVPQKRDILDSKTLLSGLNNNTLRTTPSEYKVYNQNNNIGLNFRIINSNDETIGQIEAMISLPLLVTELTKTPWWKIAFLVDRNGQRINTFDMVQENQGNELLKESWLQMQTKKFGVLLSPESPPKKVCLFYHLNVAPWTLVVNGDGEKVLRPLIRFRTIFFIITAITTLIISLTIHLVTSKINKEISLVSDAAKRIAKGQWGRPLKIYRNDEIGTLKNNFNQMTYQLQEGVQLQKSMEIAREVQQNLLPDENFNVAGIDVAATCIYYDDTGGDYFDILNCTKHKHASFIVGDVVGHGIGAALLMATTRSLLRAKLSCSKRLAETIIKVNQLLCKDTQKVGNFVTLFILRVDYSNYKIEWVRAGHEPAIVYYPESKRIVELKGKGLAVGVDAEYSYKDNEILSSKEPLVILVGTDGIWDAENEQGEQFGKERSNTVLSENAHLPAKAIMLKLKQAIEYFIGTNKQTDDITLMIVKVPKQQ